MLDPHQFRVAAAIRLGAPVCEPHQCTYCGRHVDATGTHYLSCTHSKGRISRHKELNDIIIRALRSTNTAAVLEPEGLTLWDGKRPDGQTLSTWSTGKCLVWDATVTCTFAASHLRETCLSAGAAAEKAEGSKMRKYSCLQPRYFVTPVAFETMGLPGKLTNYFINDLGKRIILATGDHRQGEFLWQRLAIAVQKGNAISVQLGILGETHDMLWGETTHQGHGLEG